MILFQKNDSKFRNLQKALSQLGIKSEGLTGSAMYAPLILFKCLLRKKRPNVYTFRYLNDYQSIFKSVLRLGSEMVVVLLCKVFGIRIWWICHNIDKETQCHYPAMSAFRRKIIKNSAEVVFVTHKLLVKHASHFLRISNVDNISLGYIEDKVYDNLACNASVDKQLNEWLHQKEKKNCKVVLVVGTDAPKVEHFDRIIPFLTAVNRSDSVNTWYAIVIGKQIDPHPNVFNVPFKYLMNKELIADKVDYYFRVMSDFSISYTAFEASALRKPIITENTGFLPELVSRCKIGYIFDYTKTEAFINEVYSKTDFAFGTFLADNNWQVAAKRIENYYFGKLIRPLRKE